jgi:signal transduction histidine kinase
LVQNSPTAATAATARPVQDRAGVPVAQAAFWARGIAFIALYVALDWVSYVQPYSPIGLTPWNPPPAIGLAMILRYGTIYGVWLAPAGLAAEIVLRGLPAPFAATLAAQAEVAIIYTALGVALKRWLGHAFDRPTLRDVIVLLAAALPATVLVALSVVGTYVAAGAIATPDPAAPAYLYWIGDMIGIAVFTPLALRLTRPGIDWSSLRPGRWEGLEWAAQAATIALAAWVSLGLKQTDQYDFFYLLLLPLVWIGLRRGLDGVCLANLAAQALVIGIAEYRQFAGTTVIEIQMLMLLMAAMCLALGTAVDERTRAEQELRRHQAAAALASNVRIADELSAAVVHELSQPLAALTTYLSACLRNLKGPKLNIAVIEGAIKKATVQAHRARDTLSKLREVFDRGEIERSPASLSALIADAVELVRSEPGFARISIEARLDADLPRVLADRTQVEQVLVNLMRNAMESLGEARSQMPRVVIDVRRRDGFAVVGVSDDGAGVPQEVAARLFEPFTTTKGHGMGLGLAICRRIVETHGGRLWLEPKAVGARFCFSLPEYDG